MGLDRRQAAELFKGFGNIALTVAQVHEKRRLEAEQKKKDEEAKAEREEEKRYRRQQDEKADTRYYAEVENQQRNQERADKVHRTNVDRQITEGAAKAEIEGRKVDTKNQADPDYYFSLWLNGEYQPKTDQQKRYFEAKLSDAEGKNKGSGTGGGKGRSERLSNSELWKEYQRQKNDKNNAIFGMPQSFREYVDAYNAALDSLDGITQPVKDPGKGGKGAPGGAAVAQPGASGGYFKPTQGTTGNPALDLYNQNILDRTLQAAAQAGAVSGGPGSPGGNPYSDTLGAGILPQDTSGIGEPVNPADFEPALEPGQLPGMGTDSTFNQQFGGIPTAPSPGMILQKRYPTVPVEILDDAATLDGFWKLSLPDQELVLDQLIYEAIKSGRLQVKQ